MSHHRLVTYGPYQESSVTLTADDLTLVAGASTPFTGEGMLVDGIRPPPALVSNSKDSTDAAGASARRHALIHTCATRLQLQSQ